MSTLAERSRIGLHRHALSALAKAAAYYGFRLKPVSGEFAFIDAEDTVRAAEAAGLSVENYYYGSSSEEMRGRLDRIVDRIVPLFDPGTPVAVVEIGAGTGVFTKRVLSRLPCRAYHVYEVNPGWSDYLARTYGHAPGFKAHACDGETLRGTETASIDLVQAHGVFVYTPTLITLSYCLESARVLKPGGRLCFDCYLDTGFGEEQRRKWMASPHRFPVVVPAQMLAAVLREAGLHEISHFREVHGPDYVDYLLFEKR